jgi:uncharacterized damage-inducible protein DinB
MKGLEIMRMQILEPLLDYEPLVGSWLSAFQDVRQRTLDTLEGLKPELIDWCPPWRGNTVSALLYHLAAIEADWLFTDILEKSKFPPQIDELFPSDVHDADGNLTSVPGTSLEAHIQRLADMREYFMVAMRAINDRDFRRARIFPEYRVTPEWVIYHLMQHEAEHRGQIMDLREAYEHQTFT